MLAIVAAHVVRAFQVGVDIDARRALSANRARPTDVLRLLAIVPSCQVLIPICITCCTRACGVMRRWLVSVDVVSTPG